MANDESRRSDFQDNRERLLEAARQIIAKRGPGALSIFEVVWR